MEEKKISLKIDGKIYECKASLTVLEACAEAGIDIPTLCYLKDINQEAACSICLVEVKGAKTLLRSCVTSIKQDMDIFTNTPRVRNARRLNLELLLAGHWTFPGGGVTSAAFSGVNASRRIMRFKNKL